MTKVNFTHIPLYSIMHMLQETNSPNVEFYTYKAQRGSTELYG